MNGCQVSNYYETGLLMPLWLLYDGKLPLKAETKACLTGKTPTQPFHVK